MINVLYIEYVFFVCFRYCTTIYFMYAIIWSFFYSQHYLTTLACGINYNYFVSSSLYCQFLLRSIVYVSFLIQSCMSIKDTIIYAFWVYLLFRRKNKNLYIIKAALTILIADIIRSIYPYKWLGRKMLLLIYRLDQKKHESCNGCDRHFY